MQGMFQKLPIKQQEEALEILKLLQQDDIQVCGRWFTQRTAFLPTQQVKEFAKCILGRIEEDNQFQNLHPCDVEFDDMVTEKICFKLEALELAMEDATNELQTGEAAEPPKKKLKVSEMGTTNQKELHMKLTARLNKTPQERCIEYYKELCKSIENHKSSKCMNWAKGMSGDEGLEKTEAEKKELKENIDLHDWSKFYMPLWFAGNVFDKDLGFLAGEFKPKSQDPMLKSFFHSAVFHNILEGSTAHGHHEAIESLGSSESSLAIKKILKNGTPSKMRILESIIDTVDASVNPRIMGQQIPGASNSWLKFQFEKAAPGKEQSICSDLFCKRIGLVFNQVLTSVEECRVACSDDKGSLLKTEELRTKSKLMDALFKLYDQ